MTPDPPNGRRIYGDYEIETMIGKGSIGKVYLARHRRIGRRAAVKVIDPDQRFEDDQDRDEFYRRLQREAELCGSLQHPNIVTLYEAGYEGDVVSFLATEYVAGESLQSRLRRTRPLPLPEALSIAADILRGLSYAHDHGVIHRDIKPANILISNEGHTKITDFGIARPLDSSLTGVNSLLGTPNYMSPEQVKSTAVTPRSDLFSAGVVMYEMLSGVRPFGAPELTGILFNVVNLDPPLVSDVNPVVPQPVAEIVARLLAKSPADRYESAAAALKDIEQKHMEVRAAAEYATVAAMHDSTTPLPTIVDEHVSSEPQTASPALTGAGATPMGVKTDTRIPPLIRRPVPAVVFWSVTLLLLASFAATVSTIRSRIRQQQPAAVITPQQAAIAQEKRQQLRSARALVAIGRYGEAIARYDGYLAKYPEGAVARTERDAAQQMLEQSTNPTSEITVARKKPHQREEPLRKKSRWERFRKWVKGE